MRVGSLVELVDDNWKMRPFGSEITPVKGKIYTVRGIVKCSNGTGIRLEEIINPKYKFVDGFGERVFNIKKFRELLPPMNVSTLIEQAQKIATSN